MNRFIREWTIEKDENEAHELLRECQTLRTLLVLEESRLEEKFLGSRAAPEVHTSSMQQMRSVCIEDLYKLLHLLEQKPTAQNQRAKN